MQSDRERVEDESLIFGPSPIQETIKTLYKLNLIENWVQKFIMSGRISKLDEFEFEEWIRNNYPDLFRDWELNISDFMDLDCWIFTSWSEIFNRWLIQKERIIK